MSETQTVRPALRDLVAAEVRAEMGRRRISGAELARAIDEPQASLQRRLSGRYPFDVDLLAHIAAYFGVPITSFFPAQARSVPTSEYGRLRVVA
jgi:transcriptional regulator with XRE-family HTH domain